ncbi:MAG: sulfite exporter TauE/SafE family protein [Candidatus Omnitrophota bacterium]|jgi:sulfite exporter TauE/SafE
MDTLITHLQLFGIGFSFGIAGPCLLICTPIIVTYAAASHRRWPQTLYKILIFLSGRLFAYMVMGCLAGLSGTVLRRYTDSNLVAFFKPLSGAVSIAFGIMLLTYREHADCPYRKFDKNIYGAGSLFLLGLAIGAAPCAPLLAVLFNIVLISKGAIQGLAYAFSFGLGTLISGTVAIVALTGLVKWIPSAFFKTEWSGLIFRIICAALLILFGVRLII